MVFFTCNHCGESVKKPSVEKHYNAKCRNQEKNISCMDCQKDFHGEEYVAHTKCISEMEKYSGKNYVVPESKNSGQKKQDTWMDIVRSILESSEYQLTAQTRNIFQRLQSYDNVPRKKSKFQNFVVNCMRTSIKMAEPVWDVLEKELENMKLAKQQEMAAAKKAQEEAKKAKKEATSTENGVKRKATEENGEDKPEKKKKKKDKKAKAELENGTTETDEKKLATEENGEDKPEKKKKVKKATAELENGTTDISEKKLENGTKEIIEETEEFQWLTVLEKLVAKNTEDVSIEKLKKKLLKKYKSKLALDALTEKQQKKFEKKFSKALKKCPALQAVNIST